jgi:hypothetical protein
MTDKTPKKRTPTQKPTAHPRSFWTSLLKICAIVFVGSVLAEYCALWVLLSWMYPKSESRQWNWTKLETNEAQISRDVTGVFDRNSTIGSYKSFLHSHIYQFVMNWEILGNLLLVFEI